MKDITITFLYQRRIGHDQFLSGQFCQRKLIKKIQQQTVNIKNFLLLDDKYTFEIGGKNKTRKQITGIDNAYVADDNIEYAQQNKIPLWLFGFLY